MSERTVLSLSKLTDTQHVLRVEEFLTQHPPGDQGQALIQLADLPDTDDPFAQVGSGLFGFLSGHPAVEDQLVASRRNGCSLLIEDESLAAQSLPWESLRDDQGQFLALSSSPLLSRTVTPRRQRTELTRPWQPPLRVLAVLAATGTQPDGRRLTAIRELQALVAGLTAGGQLDFELEVLGCDDGLPDATADTDPKLWIEQNNAAGNLTYQPLESVEQIRRRIRDSKPHVVHFFCHGFADADSQPRLELALRTDQLAFQERGSLIVEAPTLGDLLSAHPDTWLVVLNCCLGAAAGESISLARELMSARTLDLPGVIAMREAVDRRDAHLFCEVFYDSMTDEIAAAIAGNLPQDLAWAQTLPPVRQALCRARCQTLSQAEQCPEWTIPVLYVHRERFRVVRPGNGLPQPPGVADPVAGGDPSLPSDAEEILGQLRFLRSMRDELSLLPNLPDEKLAKVDARIADLQQKLLEVL